MQKFGRNYYLTVVPGTPGTVDPIFVSLPFTIEFNVIRNITPVINVASIRLYNLDPDYREQLRYNVSNYQNPFWSVVLQAGYGQYGSNMPVIFKGNVGQAWSVREGVNYITQIECYDGGYDYVNGTTEGNYPAGTPLSILLSDLIVQGFEKTNFGAVGTYAQPLLKNKTISGPTVSVLQELTGGGFFIDNGNAYCLNANEYIQDTGLVTLISSDTGLLNTPMVEQNIARFEMLFEPNLLPGRLALIQSEEAYFNGQSQIIGVRHSGMISAAVCGSVITVGDFSLNRLLSGPLVPVVPGL